MPEIIITIDNKALRDAMAKAPAKVHSGIKNWVKETGYLAERASKRILSDSVSIGSSGRTLNSIKTTNSVTGLESTVKPNLKSAYYTENGRRPGKMPPYKEGTDLASWSRRVGANPFLVARAIGKKGTKGKKFMEKAYQEVKPIAERNGNQMLSEIVRSI